MNGAAVQPPGELRGAPEGGPRPPAAEAPAGRVPPDLSLLPLPPSGPGLDPREPVWESLRGHALADRAFAGSDGVVGACCAAWDELAADTARLISLTDSAWARPKPATS